LGGNVPLTDILGRTITYLRISVTDRCNLRCQYCMPPQGVSSRAHDDILRYEEIERLVQAAAGLGIKKVRLTGGEPLVRKGIVDLTAILARIPGITELTMTTNATLLARYAQDLAQAGLQRINISLDTLQAEKYAQITRGGRMEDALAGIAAAEAAGLTPLKINTVVMRGLNDDEIADMAGLTLTHPWHVRFIELMPLNKEAQTFDARSMRSQEVHAAIEAALGPLTPVGIARNGSGPADLYRLEGAQGTVGFISPVSEHFCASCNRLRLTADGRLRLCLLSDQEIDLKPLLRGGAEITEIQAALQQAIDAKPSGHRLAERILPQGRTMSEIGG
jgi:GTP 3',8-cyclase